MLINKKNIYGNKYTHVAGNVVISSRRFMQATMELSVAVVAQSVREFVPQLEGWIFESQSRQI